MRARAIDPVQKPVGNARTIIVTLRGVKVRFSSISSNVSISMSVLVGDMTANGVVESLDVDQVRSKSGNVLSQSSFRDEVNVDGVIDSNDVALVIWEWCCIRKPNVLDICSWPNGRFNGTSRQPIQPSFYRQKGLQFPNLEFGVRPNLLL